ncbi:Flp pilus assembly complex ATPase component TadA [Agromyces mediolanus]|uniref:CpaF family protein n=1 Tax=Agromyces mediolanus TaxID=41986 RepID=UPI00203DF4F3|nr:ATPase, T2SS/T4P/T4SS family [Agromyces mediolanus]MCM3656259.1 Flp pilus assembly complex ATPase component TadA [Agromyces mediolanus]
MPDAVRTLSQFVRERAIREGVDLSADPIAADRVARAEVRRFGERALASGGEPIGDERAATSEVLAELTGFGPLQPYFDDPEVEEIWINGPDRVFIARNGVAERIPSPLSEREVRELVERMLRPSGRRLDLSQPFVDAALPDGSRLHVAIPEVTRAWSVNVRKFRRGLHSLSALVGLGALSREAAEFLRMAVLAGANLLVSGATHTGKTTLLNALGSCVRSGDRVITVEETFELDIQAGDLVAMQCRPPNLEGAGEITLRRLVKESLRMRPDRLVVGEVRDAESLDLLIALNSGIAGMCTLHANSARDALMKLCTLPLLAGRNIDAGFVVPTVAACVDLVVQLGIDRRGRRRVLEIVATTGEHGAATIETVPLFRRVDDELQLTGERMPRLEKFRAAGLDPVIVLGGAAA